MRRRTTLSQAKTRAAELERLVGRVGQLATRSDAWVRDAYASRRSKERGPRRAEIALGKLQHALETVLRAREVASRHAEAVRREAGPDEQQVVLGAERELRRLALLVQRVRANLNRAQPVVRKVLTSAE